ncbi:hypothetical protein CONLIGDRAFT_676852 [Coniochaeta ligniaria NRRL 30616]|uniref:Mid2 domain-containing protein n=1 Tax=Coniochaeta ligniaria NRRL 30616 TaxID=1408157 RepID=A0A1J7J0Y1_9PEZI|nr:hypothetical protein CONLIGDRAFT_676852 [Coniochaeta ligniaria NRRL 30616]
MTKHAVLLALATLAKHATAGRRPEGSQWNPPAPTKALEPHDRAYLQISPRPTDSPLFRNAGELRRRDSASTSISSNTCGFWTDDGSAMSCDPAYTCTNQGQYRGCCVGSECATSSFPTVCYGATEKQCENPGAETMCCTYDINYPYCVTYLWATTASPNQVFSLFNCDTHDWAGQQILSAEPFAVTTTGTSSAPGGQATVPANDGSNSTSSNNNSGNSGTPVGAIVGGVIGGLAVIGIVVLGVVFMMLRYRKQQAAKLNGQRGRGDEAAPLSGAGSSPTSPANHYGPPVIKAEEYGTPMTQNSSPPGIFPTPTGLQYTTLPHPEDKLAASDGAVKTKQFSELGIDRRSELAHDQRSELGEDRRAELPN